MTRRRMAVGLFAALLLAMATLAPESFGAGKNAPGLSAEAIGIVNPATIREKIPEYTRLRDLKKVYDSELAVYADYLRSQILSYSAELKKLKEAECAGKSEAEKRTIEASYASKAQAKQAELNQQFQVRAKELQDKLNAEMAKVDQKVKESIEAVSTEKGLVIILNRDVVYFGGVDITSEVVARTMARK